MLMVVSIVKGPGPAGGGPGNVPWMVTVCGPTGSDLIMR